MLLVLLLSCVTKGAHEVVEVQLDATRTALSAKNASCYEEVRDREVRLLAHLSPHREELLLDDANSFRIPLLLPYLAHHIAQNSNQHLQYQQCQQDAVCHEEDAC